MASLSEAVIAFSRNYDRNNSSYLLKFILIEENFNKSNESIFIVSKTKSFALICSKVVELQFTKLESISK